MRRHARLPGANVHRTSSPFADWIAKPQPCSVGLFLARSGSCGAAFYTFSSNADVAASGGAAAPPRVDEGARAERGLALRRGQAAHPRQRPAHDLRGGAVSEHRRVLGAWDGHVPDPRRHVHARVPLLLRPLRQARRPARPARAASPRGERRADGPQARRRHVGRPRRSRGSRRRALRGDDPRAQGKASRGLRSRC